MPAYNKGIAMKSVSFTLPVHEVSEIFDCTESLDRADEHLCETLAPYKGDPEWEEEDETEEEFEARREKTRDRLFSSFAWHLCQVAESVNVGNGARVESRLLDCGEIEITLCNPATLLNALINGDGFVHADKETSEWEDPAVVRAHLGWLNRFFAIYGDSRPEFSFDP